MELDAILKLLEHGGSGLTVAVIWWFTHQKNRRNGNTGKDHMLEKLADLLEAYTKRMESYDKVILATDDMNYPKIWSDHGQQVRTHQTVNTILETQEELVKLVTKNV